MDKSKTLKSISKGLLKEIGKKQTISPDKITEIEKNLDSNLAKNIGNNWAMLPATGPYVMALFLIFNYTLVPLGITPATVVDTTIEKIKAYAIDEKLADLMDKTKDGIKKGGEQSSDRVKEIMKYLNSTGDEVGENVGILLNQGLTRSKSILERSLDSGKSLIGKIFRKNKDDEESNHG